MKIQDVIFAVGSIVFNVALWPSIRSVNKPALFTSVTTSFWLFVFAVTYTTLGLTLAAATTFVGAIEWGILALQKKRQLNNQNLLDKVNE